MCALVGSSILVASHLSTGTSSWTGDLYGLLTGFFFTGYILAVGRCREALSTANTMLYSSALCALILLPCMLVANISAGEPMVPASLTGWLSVFALAWLAHLLGQGMVAFGVGRLNTSLAAVILCLEGVGAMAVGALFYAEARGPFDLVAVILIVWASHSLSARCTERRSEADRSQDDHRRADLLGSYYSFYPSNDFI